MVQHSEQLAKQLIKDETSPASPNPQLGMRYLSDRGFRQSVNDLDPAPIFLDPDLLLGGVL